MKYTYTWVYLYLWSILILVKYIYTCEFVYTTDMYNSSSFLGRDIDPTIEKSKKSSVSAKQYDMVEQQKGGNRNLSLRFRISLNTQLFRTESIAGRNISAIFRRGWQLQPTSGALDGVGRVPPRVVAGIHSPSYTTVWPQMIYLMCWMTKILGFCPVKKW